MWACSGPTSRWAPSVDSLPPTKNFVDDAVFAKLKTLGVPPSPVCDDATFLRRVSVDIAGRLPTLEETRAFLADQDPAKRDRAIDRLLDSARLCRLLRQQMDRRAAKSPAEPQLHAWHVRVPRLDSREPVRQ